MSTLVTVVSWPTADSYTEFTPVGATTNYECLLTEGGAEYNYAGLALDMDLFVVEPAIPSADGVDSIGVLMKARHDAVSGTFKVRAVAKLGANYSYSAEVAIDGSYQVLTFGSLSCPDGGSWDLTKYAAAVFGYQATELVPGDTILVDVWHLMTTFTETAPATHDAGTVEMPEDVVAAFEMPEDVIAAVEMPEDVTSTVKMAEDVTADVQMPEDVAVTIPMVED